MRSNTSVKLWPCAAVVLFGLVWSGSSGAAEASTVLITGSSRGIGLEFARQYGKLGWRVIATCREPARADDLAAIARAHPSVVIEPMDVIEPASVAAVAAKYRGQPIDLLINNAAHLGPRESQQFGRLDYELFEDAFAVNAIGPMRVSEAFVDHVAASRGKKIVTLSSVAASISTLSPPANLYPYRASKAALNLLMRNLAIELAPRGILVGLFNPGLVDTRGILALKPGDPVPDEFAPLMPLIQKGTLNLITPEESVTAMRGLIDRLTPEQSGRFINYDGTPGPW
jgi:NAD(P)-dependent dehydrogenase (short-subunit alcohol dehydrogenase family)